MAHCCQATIPDPNQVIDKVARQYNDVIMSAMASQITDVSFVCLTVCSGADQRRHQSSASLTFVRGIHRWTGYGDTKPQWVLTCMCFLVKLLQYLFSVGTQSERVFYEATAEPNLLKFPAHFRTTSYRHTDSCVFDWRCRLLHSLSLVTSALSVWYQTWLVLSLA